MSASSIPPHDPEATPPSKTCTKCGQSFPATTEYFHRAKLGKYQLAAVCKSCASIERKRRYYANIESEKAYKEAHKAEAKEYHRRWREENHDHVLEYKRRYRAENIEQCRQWGREWVSRNLDKAATQCRNREARKRGNGGKHTVEDVQAQYDRQRGRCFYCGKKVKQTFHVDHVIPLALGGSNGPENLVIACPECNLRKRAKHPMDFNGMMF